MIEKFYDENGNQIQKFEKFRNLYLTYFEDIRHYRTQEILKLIKICKPYRKFDIFFLLKY